MDAGKAIQNLWNVVHEKAPIYANKAAIKTLKPEHRGKVSLALMVVFP